MDRKSQGPVSILVIDDEEEVRSLLQEFFEGEGYWVNTAENAERGLEQFRRTRPLLTFLDLKMPGMGGMEFLRRVRLEKADQTLIVMTALAESEVRDACLEAGAGDFLTKPVSLDELSKLAVRYIPCL